VRVALALAALMVLPLAADAQQRYPQRGGGETMIRRDKGEAPKTDTRAGAQEPYSALERELPSLKTDLKLNDDQLNAWAVFERDVRDVAEMDRSRRKHLMALREAGERPPTAITVITTLAEEDRNRADATADLKRHLETLYARLDESQRRTLDKRVVLSQTEPLGK
jgi:hypothetical protein